MLLLWLAALLLMQSGCRRCWLNMHHIKGTAAAEQQRRYSLQSDADVD
jgi:hypothetical protein